MRFLAILFAFTCALSFIAEARDIAPVEGGEVTVPLAQYTALLQQLALEPRPAPTSHAVGQSDIVVSVSDQDGRFAATVNATLSIEVFEDEWTLVPILPPGTALRQATVDGSPVQLVEGPDGLGWSTNQAGTYGMTLTYGVNAERYENGFVLPLAVPRAAATQLNLSLPAPDLDATVVPAADVHTSQGSEATQVTASIPATSLVLVSWQSAHIRPYAVSRAQYTGQLRNETLEWKGVFQVQLFESGRITLPILPSNVTLNNLTINGAPATVLVQDGHFATLVQGRGLHSIEAAFQVPVVTDNGPPQAQFHIPRIPVSRFDLVLPGQKDVKVTPGVDVVTTEQADGTKATAFIPMTNLVTFSWTEAIPTDLRGQVRANADLYHTVHAEEGVLHAHAVIAYEITHGEAESLILSLPEVAQVNRIVAPSGGVSDWAVTGTDETGRKLITVFLERAISGGYQLEVSYELLLGAGPEAMAAIDIPLLHAEEVRRQRGMIALLTGDELTLTPVTEVLLSAVGENQLPPAIRNQIDLPVSHTYKYTSALPTLVVAAAAPERKQGRFDAQVDTLISLGDVTMKGAATVGIEVKSGSLLDLALRAPGNVNVLDVTSPSLRAYEVQEIDGAQLIQLAFTRQMEGQFRVEIVYERIMASGATGSIVPTISVADAEVEHGRIAIEATTAVEVRASTVEGLSNLEINELPQQLVLKTTNPILLAFRYVSAEAPVKLGLTITRHQEIEVQVAAIEQAEYQTLITRDGLSVTTARLTVRNSRRQFLRLDLPPESEVWSVFVNGRAEKPAYAGEDPAGGASAVLIRMINSADGFPVDIVYATPVEAMTELGTISSRLPRPDMVVTNSRWDVFLPKGPRYRMPDTTMDLVVRGVHANPRRMQAEALARAGADAQAQLGQPLRITVPTQGIRFGFEKLYANESPDEAEFTVRYASAGANKIGLGASLLGMALLWVGIIALAGRWLPLPRSGVVGALGGGVTLLIATIGYLGTSPVPASILAVLTAVGFGGWALFSRFRAWRLGRTVAN